jgi:hypothetical protein
MAEMTGWQIVGFIIGVIFNIAVVAKIRSGAVEKGQAFLASGRGAMVLVFVLCLVEQLVTGKFEALQNADAFLQLLNSAWIMAGAAVGAHTVYRTASK